MKKPFSFSNFGVDNHFDSFAKQVCIFIEGMWFEKPEYANSEFRVLVNCTEPLEVINQCFTLDDIIKNHKKFDLILTSHDYVLENCSNAKLFPFGSGWVPPIPDNYKKEVVLSFLSGSKQSLPGHKLRHEILNHADYFNNNLKKQFHHTYSGEKQDILYPAMFSIIVENTQHRNYFTEKIVDCFLAKTIPLYWGCPNIDDFFDKAGIIKFTDVNELILKSNMITSDIYNDKQDTIEKNFNTAIAYKDFHKRVSKEIEKALCQK
jgi:hypothetical protein